MSFMQPRTATIVQALIQAALDGALTEAQAKQLVALGPEAVVVALLATSRHIAEQQTQLSQYENGGNAASRSTAAPDPSTPSGMIPVYTKPNASKRRGRPGAKDGHPGTRRPAPTRIDRREAHRLKQCPDCGGRLQRCHRTRTRIIEDIPEHIQPVVTEHTIHRDYCPNCKKDVEPVVPDAMPGATLGHRVVALTAWLHYGLGITIEQVIQLLSHHLQTKLTAGGLVHAWQRLAEVLVDWYKQIGTEAKKSSHLHGDETGWRVNGQTHWLWCFANHHVCYYMIDRCRGSPALQKFFTEAFKGVLITDFWSAYESVCAEDRQYCLVHLLRELEKVDQRNTSAEWRSFARRLRRLLGAGIRLRRRGDFVPGRHAATVDRLNRRLAALAADEPADADARRLTHRLRRHVEHIFTFLDYADVPFENNFAERQIRPAVIIRKNSLGNRSDRGAATQSILMSVYRTLRLRGLNPTDTVTQALRTYVDSGSLLQLPTQTIAEG